MPTVSGRFLGSYGMNAGAVMELEWIPSPGEMQSRVFNVMDNLEDRSMPLAASAQVVSDTIAERFRTQTDPEGDPWEPWSGGSETDYYDPVSDKWSTHKRTGYATYAEQHNLGGILEQTLALRDSATKLSRVIIDTNDVIYNSGGLPNYGMGHQEGIPDRRTQSGSPNPLPRRAFLGLTDEAEIVIMETFDLWFREAIQLYPTKTGRVGRRHALRGPGGRFVKAED